MLPRHQSRWFSRNRLPVETPRPAARVRLLRYLERCLGVTDLRYASAPAALPGGWETSLYRFQLQFSPRLPPAFRQPLVLRIYAGPHGAPRARFAYAVQEHMRRLGYPVPELLLLEPGSDLLGGPFLIMEAIPGDTLFRELLHRPWKILSLSSALAQLHARLHMLPTIGFPLPRDSGLPRWLEQLEALIREHGLDALAPGLDWLRSHAPAPPCASSILHLDFHPLNVMRCADRSLTVLDWDYAGVGDRHADLAVSLMLIECVPAPETNFVDRLALTCGRPLLAQLYLRAYRKLLPVVDETLAYYQAWAVFSRLCRYGRWLCAGPEATGCKPSLLARLSPSHLADLCRYFRAGTGVSIDLESLTAAQ